MNNKVFALLFSLLLCTTVTFAQEDQEQAAKSSTVQAVESAINKATSYYQNNNYQEAFDLLRSTDQQIASSSEGAAQQHALRYETSKVRMKMYMKMRRAASAMDHLNAMENHAKASNDDNVQSDLLYQKAIYYYTFGQNDEGNAVFKEMASKLTAKKEYDKVDKVYQTLIANGRRSNSASLVAQSYSSYMAWKDSTNAIKHADEIGALKKQIADNETVIADQDSSLSSRMAIIVGLCVLAAILAAALLVGAVVLLRFILLTRKQQKTIRLANDNNALKAKFIGNISAQLDPTLRKLDDKKPEVKALLDFSQHIQTLSTLENSADEAVELEDTQIQPFCESLIDQIRGKVKSGVTLTVNAPKMNAPINKEYVSHILQHLLANAAVYTPEGGTIWLDFKKRCPQTSVPRVEHR